VAFDFGYFGTSKSYTPQTNAILKGDLRHLRIIKVKGLDNNFLDELVCERGELRLSGPAVFHRVSNDEQW
jgi:hypothetical protein